MKEVLESHRVGLKGDMTHLKNLLAHIARENIDRENPDSLPDWIRKDWKPDGLHTDGTPSADALETREKIITELKRRPQSNSCMAFEFIISAGEGFPPDKWHDYFEEAKAFLCTRYGMENLISSAIHTDEKTPHMHLVFVPVIKFTMRDGTTERRYSASDYLEDGASLSEGEGTSAAVAGKDRFKLKKAALVQLHTDFNEAVGKKFGLERGEEGSRASHTSLVEYSRKMKESQKRIAELERDNDIKQKKLKQNLETQSYLLDKLKNDQQKLDEREKATKSKEDELIAQEGNLNRRENDLNIREQKIEKREKELEACLSQFDKSEEVIYAEQVRYSLANSRGTARSYRPQNPPELMFYVSQFVNAAKTRIAQLERKVKELTNQQDRDRNAESFDISR